MNNIPFCQDTLELLGVLHIHNASLTHVSDDAWHNPPFIPQPATDEV